MIGLRKRKLTKSELKDVEVELVSLLFDDMKPANRKGYVQKMQSRKFKSDEQGRLYVTVMEPDVKDSQGDVASKEEIQKACDYFAQKGMLRKNDVNHNGEPTPDFYIAENYILKSEDKEHFPGTKVGSWVQVLKCTNLDSDLWKKVKAGKFNGVSLAGWSNEKSDSFESIAKSLESLANIKKKAEESGDDSLVQAISDIETRLKKLEENANLPKEEEELVKGVGAELMKAVAELKKAISPSIKEGEDMKRIVKTVNGMPIVIDPARKELQKGIADLDSGNKMNVFNDNLGQQFIDATLLNAEDDTLSDITVAPLSASNKIDSGLIADVILYNTSDGNSEQAHSHSDISVSPQEIDAHISLAEGTAESYRSSMGVEEFGAYMEAKISGGIREALKKLLFRGDRAGATAVKAMDGLVATATSGGDITQIDGASILDRIDNAMLTFSEKILLERDKFVIYLPPSDYVSLMQSRNVNITNQGRLIVIEGKLYLDGIPVKQRLLPSGYMVIGLAKFIVLGYVNDAKLKVEHSGATHKFYWYPRIVCGMTYVTGGYVKVFKHVTNQPPYAYNAEITEDGLNTGDVLSGSYAYGDSYGDLEGTTTFRWLSSATEGGTYSAIGGATNSSYTIQSADATKYIKFEVTPVDENGVAGSAVLSAAVGPCTDE